MAQSGGLLMTVYLAAVHLDKEVFVATLMAVVAAVDIAKVFAYFTSGLLPENWLMVTAVSVPAVIVGTLHRPTRQRPHVGILLPVGSRSRSSCLACRSSRTRSEGNAGSGHPVTVGTKAVRGPSVADLEATGTCCG